MNIGSPAEIVENYSRIGKIKAEKETGKILAMAVLAGFLIGFGAAAVNTATHSLSNVSMAKVVGGLLFPFGLGMVMLMGAELFTGNTMICISVLNQETTVLNMLRNWLLVYIGNMLGAGLLAIGCSWFGQLDYSAGGLAVYTIKVAAAKCAIPFGNGVVQGIFCNLLVCAGVMCSLSAKDTAGRILGAYIPVAFFVICGFEHCVANMYYIPAGIFAKAIPAYAQAAQEAGVNLSVLTWGRFFGVNLLPVTLGNIIGGMSLGLGMWISHVGPGIEKK